MGLIQLTQGETKFHKNIISVLLWLQGAPKDPEKTQTLDVLSLGDIISVGHSLLYNPDSSNEVNCYELFPPI